MTPPRGSSSAWMATLSPSRTGMPMIVAPVGRQPASMKVLPVPGMLAAGRRIRLPCPPSDQVGSANAATVKLPPTPPMFAQPSAEMAPQGFQTQFAP